ncbi:unnamed protein product [Lampetra planeri]
MPLAEEIPRRSVDTNGAHHDTETALALALNVLSFKRRADRHVTPNAPGLRLRTERTHRHRHGNGEVAVGRETVG